MLPAMTDDPALAPDALMVFDGVCRFCSTTVRLVNAMDRTGVIRFAPVQSPYGAILCRANGVDPDDPSTFLFFDRGRPLGSTDGMLAMAARLPRPWRWLRVFALVPRPLREAVYRWTARNRYRLLGRRRTCLMPDARLKARFVEVPPAG